jgi:hypothetical protein
MYEENCGLESVLMSWGHDEYLYQASTKKHRATNILRESERVREHGSISASHFEEWLLM